MRAMPSLFVLVWRNKPANEYWAQLYLGLDDVCMEYDERDRATVEVVSGAELVFTAAGPRWVAFNVAREAKAWREAKAEQATAVEAEIQDHREDLV